MSAPVRFGRSAYALPVALTVLVASCSTGTEPPSIAMVLVTPPTATLTAVGEAVQLTAAALSSDGGSVTTAVTWASSNTSVATVSSSGLVTAVGNGTATITATADGVAGSASVTVAQVVESVTVTPGPQTLASFGATVQMTGSALDTNGNPVSGASVAWSSSDPGVATVSATGLVTAVADGMTTVTATVDGVEGSASVTVAQAVATVAVTPAAQTLASLGQTVQMSAAALDANDNAVANASVTWSSSDQSVATVSAAGLVTAVANGTATITATASGVAGTAMMTVQQVVDAVSVSPSSAALAVAATAQLTANVVDALGATVSGSDVTWTTSNASIASVSSSGLVTGVANGLATITATSAGKSGTATVSVGPLPVATVTVSPGSGSIDRTNGTLQLSTTLKDANDNTLTGRIVTWSSSNTSVATVSSSGLVTGKTEGTVTVTATSEGQSGTSSVTVTIPVGSATVSPASPSVVLDQTTTLTVTLKDLGGTVLTGRTVAWSSNNTSIATVTGGGVVTGKAAGSATITATSEGKSGSASLTVAGVPMAWVHAVGYDQPGTYTPNASDASNLSGGNITVTRFETGKYAVLFGGLGTNSGRIGNRWSVMVNANLFQSGGTPIHQALCNLNSVQVTDLRVDVWCENIVTGAAMDAQFRVFVVAEEVLNAPAAFSFHHDFAASSSYVPLTSLSWNSSGSGMSVGFAGQEVIHTLGPSFSLASRFATPTAPPTANPDKMGSHRACTVRSVTASTATMWCFNAAGSVDKTIQHGFLSIQVGRTGGMLGHAHVSADGSLFANGYNSSGGSVTSTKTGTGRYEIVWNGLKSPNTDGDFAVMVSPAGGASWESCGHRVFNANPISVQVQCVDTNGTAKDVGAAFEIMVIR